MIGRLRGVMEIMVDKDKLHTYLNDLSEGKIRLDEIPHDTLSLMIKRDRKMEGDVTILQIDSDNGKIQAFVKKFDGDFWYSFENGEFKLFSCTYEID